MANTNASSQILMDNSSNKADQNTLFYELSPEDSTHIEGGFKQRVAFNSRAMTKEFRAGRGSTITLSMSTNNYRYGRPISSRSNPDFMVRLRNLDTGRTTEKLFFVGLWKVKWSGVNGGRYKIDFFDTKDEIVVNGIANITT